MNEVTQIHLGHQAFTIAIDAQHELRKYLDAIQKQVVDQEVIDEVELRMAELLTEHGITDKKVILPADIDYLKEQLGDPQDFKEDTEEESVDKPTDGKRLFRDTDNAMLAGVASGLASYFGISVIVIRILFIISVITGGWGIVLYILLWLLIPEAKTSSDRLKMAGKAVTVDSLKEVVERADVKGAAQRVNKSLAGPLIVIYKAILKIIGFAFIVAGLCALFGLLASTVYLFIDDNKPLQNTLFPVGLNEHLLLYCALLVAGLIALFIVLFGLAIFRRKWPIRVWITGILAGLIFISLAIGGALATDTVPNIRDRYYANVHTTTHTVQPFTETNILGSDVGIAYILGSSYSVSFKYYDHPDLSKIKISEANGTLTVDSQNFNDNRDCTSLCIPSTYNMLVTITSPEFSQTNPAPKSPAVPMAPVAPPVIK